MLRKLGFLHQTTTKTQKMKPSWCCISFDSYIKPQQRFLSYKLGWVVYLLIPTSNHNHKTVNTFGAVVVYLLIPTSNHNSTEDRSNAEEVVYLLIPTSNHNCSCCFFYDNMLYIFWFLHQTTTIDDALLSIPELYIFWFLHQTTT